MWFCCLKANQKKKTYKSLRLSTVAELFSVKKWLRNEKQKTQKNFSSRSWHCIFVFASFLWRGKDSSRGGTPFEQKNNILEKDIRKRNGNDHPHHLVQSCYQWDNVIKNQLSLRKKRNTCTHTHVQLHTENSLSASVLFCSLLLVDRLPFARNVRNEFNANRFVALWKTASTNATTTTTNEPVSEILTP